MRAVIRTLVFVSAGVALGILGARMRTRASVGVISTNSRDPSPGAGTRPARATDARLPGHDAGIRQRDIQPTDRRYDPFALHREEPDLGLQEIFESEPRDPAFAPVLEQRIHRALGTVFQELRLEDKIRNVRTECKTLSCYTVIEVSRADLEQVYDEINGILVGDSQQPGMVRDLSPDHVAAVTFYDIYRPETRDDDYYYKTFLVEAMRLPLELAKQRYLGDRRGAK